MNQPGAARTIAFAVVLIAYVLSFFHRFAPAGIATDLVIAFQTTAASLGALAATYFYVYTLMQVPTGVLVDTIGPRRILIFGSVTAALGSLVFAMASSLDMALVGRTLIGLGVSVVFIAMLKLIALWFDESRFATMVGLSMLIGNAGSVLAGTPLTAVAQTVSWRGVFIGTAIVSLLIAIASWAFIKDTVREKTTGGGGTGGVDRTRVLSSLAGVLRNRDTWPPVVVNFGLAGSFFAFGGLWATPYLMHVHNMSRVGAANHLSLYFAGFAIGCLLIGALSDRIGRRKPVLLGAGIVLCAIWAILVSGTTLPAGLSHALFVLMGLATAGFSLTWACAKEVNPPALSGMSTSVTNMGGFLAGALLQPGVGFVMDRLWDGNTVDGVRQYADSVYLSGIAVIGATALLGTLAVLFVRETGCRNICKPSA